MRKLTICLIGIVTALALLLIANGCSHSDYAQTQAQGDWSQPAVAQQPPVIVVNQPSHDGFMSGYLMGHLTSGWHGYGYGYGYHAPVHHNTTIIQQSVTKNVTVNKPVIAVPRANAMVYRPRVTSRPVSSIRPSGSFRRR